MLAHAHSPALDMTIEPGVPPTAMQHLLSDRHSTAALRTGHVSAGKHTVPVHAASLLSETGGVPDPGSTQSCSASVSTQLQNRFHRCHLRTGPCRRRARTSPVWSLSTAAATYSGPPSAAVQMRTVLSAPAVTSWLWSARNLTSACGVVADGQRRTQQQTADPHRIPSTRSAAQPMGARRWASWHLQQVNGGRHARSP